MKWCKRWFLALFTIVITLIAIAFNIPKSFMGGSATIFNFIVSITFLLLWFIFSLYHGKMQNKKYLKFILIYWGINVISNIVIIIFLINNYEGMFLLPLSLWYTTPTYGIDYLLDGKYISIFLATMPLGLIFSSLGYGIGLIISRRKRS